MKYINKLTVRILAAVLAGFLFAGAVTKITYTCAPSNGAAGCVSFDKAVMHLGDLMHNKQDSLVQFITAFAVTSLVTFTLLSIIIMIQKRR